MTIAKMPAPLALSGPGKEWGVISTLLRTRIGDRAFDAWFGQAKVEESRVVNRVCLSFPTPFIARLVQRDFLSILKELWTNFRIENIEVKVTARSRSVGGIVDTGIDLSRRRASPTRISLRAITTKPVVADIPPTGPGKEDPIRFDLSTVFCGLTPAECMAIEIEVDSYLNRMGRITAELCIKYFCMGYGLKEYQVVSRSLTDPLPEARKLAIQVAYLATEHQTTTIAKRFSRTEREILAFVRKVKEERDQDGALNARLDYHLHYLRGRLEAVNAKRRSSKGR